MDITGKSPGNSRICNIGRRILIMTATARLPGMGGENSGFLPGSYGHFSEKYIITG